METVYEETDFDLRIILQSRSCPCKGYLGHPEIPTSCYLYSTRCLQRTSQNWVRDGPGDPWGGSCIPLWIEWKWVKMGTSLLFHIFCLKSTILTCIFFFFIRKRWHLFPPEDTPFLYPTRIPYEENWKSVFSKINVVNPDLKRFPQFRKARRHMVSAEPRTGTGFKNIVTLSVDTPAITFKSYVMCSRSVQMTDSGPFAAALLLDASFSSCRFHTVRLHRSWKGNERRVHGSSWWWRGEWTVEEDKELSHFYLG